MKTYRRTRRTIALSTFLAATLLSSVLAADKSAARFEGTDSLLRPEGYREWIFVGSSLGLQYDPKDEKPERETGNLEYKNVYLNPAAYREFAKTGRFPEGTVLVLETASSETKKEPGLQGSFAKEYQSLSAAVKDSKRFKEGWAYFRFGGTSGALKRAATPSPKEACYNCHREKAALDNVFTQFYPVLRAVAKPPASK